MSFGSKKKAKEKTDASSSSVALSPFFLFLFFLRTPNRVRILSTFLHILIYSSVLSSFTRPVYPLFLSRFTFCCASWSYFCILTFLRLFPSSCINRGSLGWCSREVPVSCSQTELGIHKSGTQTETKREHEHEQKQKIKTLPLDRYENNNGGQWRRLFRRLE